MLSMQKVPSGGYIGYAASHPSADAEFQYLLVWVQGVTRGVQICADETRGVAKGVFSPSCDLAFRMSSTAPERHDGGVPCPQRPATRSRGLDSRLLIQACRSSGSIRQRAAFPGPPTLMARRCPLAINWRTHHGVPDMMTAVS